MKEATQEVKEINMEIDGEKPAYGKMDDADSQQTDGTGPENGAAADEKPSKTETEPKQEVAKKKKTKRTEVPVNEMVPGGLLSPNIKKAQEEEYEMAL